ncbi:amidohydrolase [Pseudonocardia lacus]|uniref:amidohydrolase n=1 Tax=Pseudonocardia lacus TaxID=2835865 RepID=UPI0027E2A2CF|nr:amidohydrolase family protein [Pseudonocardia lacus]
MPRTLLVGAGVLDPGADPSPAPGAVEVDGAVVTWVGGAAEARERPGRVLDLTGATITPAFVDAHVHATATGLLVDGLDLTGCPSPRALLDAVAARVAARPGALVWGHGWQELGWPGPAPDRAALDRAAAGAPVYLSRIDVHSALVSSALLDRAPAAVGARGFADAALSTQAHHHVRRAALAAVDEATRGAAQRAFLADAAARGVGVVHECAGPDISSVADLAALLALSAELGTRVVGYWGQPVRTATEARDLLAATGAHGLAGDLFADGSLGSRTAALRAPYRDEPTHCGHRYLEPDAIAAHVAACTGIGVQAGFHVIGDAAADAVLAGLTEAARRTGTARPHPPHRLEHLEMLDPAQAVQLAALGVVASVQPLFDAFWGGPAGMYAERLGAGRAAGMNPYARLRDAGVVLALGSDAPVTPVGPWAAVRAAVEHRTPGSGLTAAQALAAHTVGGHRAAGDRSPLAGRLVAGAAASYTVWDGTAPLDGASGAPRCLRTVQDGRTLHDTLDERPGG